MAAQFLFLTQPHRELLAAIDDGGPIPCGAAPPLELKRTPVLDGIQNRFPVALACEYDSANPPVPINEIRHHLEVSALALQLVRPVDEHTDYWLEFDDDALRILQRSATLALPENLSDPVLAYQQHHATRPEDVRRAAGLLPLLSRAMSPSGSWTHPCGSIHRALIFFSQGYSVGLEPLPQLCWAAGLDSLYASKGNNRRLQGGREISRRLQAMFGPDFAPYNARTVHVPAHQIRPLLRLRDIGEHIFWLRNACIHGAAIPDVGWLSAPNVPPESGYAYQLMECSEIMLRESLLLVLEDQAMFDVFVDAARLDAYF